MVGVEMTEAERRALDALATELRLRAAQLPADSKWRAWMLRRARTCAAAGMLPPTAALAVVPGGALAPVTDLPLPSRRASRVAVAAVAAATLAYNVSLDAKRADYTATGSAPTPVHVSTHDVYSPPPNPTVRVVADELAEEAEAA